MFVLFPSLQPTFVPQKARSSRVGVYYAQRGLAFSAPGYFVHPHMLSSRNRSPHPIDELRPMLCSNWTWTCMLEAGVSQEQQAGDLALRKMKTLW